MCCYLSRHGDHKDNVLTETGRDLAEKAAQWVLADIKAHGYKPGVKLISSTPGRARETCDIYERVLRAGGIALTRFEPVAALDPAKGIGEFMKEADLAYGCGAVTFAWKLASHGLFGLALPKDAETWEAVGARSAAVIAEMEKDGSIAIAVCHGGTIEPMVDTLLGGSEPILRDLPSAAVIAIGVNAETITLADPSLHTK